MGRLKVGHFQADGNAYNLNLGWIPNYGKFINLNAVAGEIVSIEWFNDFTDDYAVVTRRLTDNGTTGTDTVEYVTSGGHISSYNTTAVQSTNPVKITGGKGVTIAATWMDDDDEIYYIVAQSDEFKDIGDVA